MKRANLFLTIVVAVSLSTVVTAFSVNKENCQIPFLDGESDKANVAKDADDNDSSVKECTVWFGTNRKKQENPKTGDFMFTDDRASSTTWGKATVCMPRNDILKKRSTGTKSRKTMPEVESRIPLDQDDVFCGMREYMKKDCPLPGKRQDVLLFLHGFYNTFDDAGQGAAQLATDLDMNGRTAFFSWPSKGRISANLMASMFSGPFVSGYISDEATIQASERAISEFLLTFSTKWCVDHKEGEPSVKVHVIAHSMGCRALLRVLQNVAINVEKRDMLKLGQVIMMAPDVDSVVFKHLTQDIGTMMPPGSIERMTLYASDDDMAIRASAIFHDYPRAGAEATEYVDTINVPNIGGDMIGHQYYAKSHKNLIADVKTLLATNAPPGSSTREYVFSPDGHADSVDSRKVVWQLRMVDRNN